MTDTTLSTESSGDSFSPAEAAYFSSRGEDTSGLTADVDSGSPPAAEPTKATPSTSAPASGQDMASNEPSDSDGEEVIIVGKDGKPRAQGSGRFVPHQALHAERERRKAAEERFSRADERLSVLNEILTKAEQPAPATKAADDDKPIDAAVDPIGALQQYQRKIAALEARLSETAKQQDERASAAAFKQAFERDAVAFIKEQPDFLPAYKYILENRHVELEAMGFVDKAERDRMIAQDERAIVTQAMQAKRSPSQIIYKLAQARGYKPAPAEPARTEAKAPNVMEKIDSIAKAQQTVGASLSGAGGSSGEGLTIDALANMSESDYLALQAKVGKAGMRKLLGG